MFNLNSYLKQYIMKEKILIKLILNVVKDDYNHLQDDFSSPLSNYVDLNQLIIPKLETNEKYTISIIIEKQ